MYILSQDRTIIIKMSGVYLQFNRWTTVERGAFLQREVEHKEYAIMCISESEFVFETVGDDASSFSKIHKVGSFSTENRAKQEIEAISQAILNKDNIYMIKTK